MKVETKVKRTNQLTLTGGDIVKLLQFRAEHEHDMLYVQDNAEVEFQVPADGDWSGTTLSITDANPVTVTWATTGAKCPKEE